MVRFKPKRAYFYAAWPVPAIRVDHWKMVLGFVQGGEGIDNLAQAYYGVVRPQITRNGYSPQIVHDPHKETAPRDGTAAALMVRRVL